MTERQMAGVDAEGIEHDETCRHDPVPVWGDDHRHDPWPEVSYGAMARAAAMVAGDPDWVNVTRWPREGVAGDV